jgi:SH3-like domain-containing protein
LKQLPVEPKHIKRFVVIGILLLLLPDITAAAEYRSIAAPKAVLYDAPSAQGKKLFLLGQGYPVEIIVNLGDWLKVRDNKGSLSWVEAKQLASKRTLLLTANTVELHEKADASSPLLSRIDKDVVVDLVETASPDADGKVWVKVHHRDGLTGYIPASSVWGL